MLLRLLFTLQGFRLAGLKLVEYMLFVLLLFWILEEGGKSGGLASTDARAGLRVFVATEAAGGSEGSIGSLTPVGDTLFTGISIDGAVADGVSTIISSSTTTGSPTAASVPCVASVFGSGSLADDCSY